MADPVQAVSDPETEALLDRSLQRDALSAPPTTPTGSVDLDALAERSIRRDNPFGYFTAPEAGPSGMEGFLRNLGKSIAPVLRPFSTRPEINQFVTQMNQAQPGEGFGGFMGTVTGGAIPSVGAMAAGGPAGGVLVAAMQAGIVSRETFQSTDSTSAALGVAIIDFSVNSLGLHVSAKLGGQATKSLANAFLDRDFAEAGKVLHKIGIGSSFESAQGVATLIGQETWKAAVGAQDWQTAEANIKANIAAVAAGGFVGGALFEMPAAMIQPGARAVFRELMRRDAIRSMNDVGGVGTKPGQVPHKPGEAALEAAGGKGAASDPDLVQNMVGRMDPEARQEAKTELEAALKADETAPPEQKMTPEDRANAEFVRSELEKAAQNAAAQTDQTPAKPLQAAQEGPEAKPAIQAAEDATAQGGVGTPKEPASDGQFANPLVAKNSKEAKRLLGLNEWASAADMLAAARAAGHDGMEFTGPQVRIKRIDLTSSQGAPPATGPTTKAMPRKMASEFLNRVGVSHRLDPKTITDREALRASLSRQRAAAAEAYRAGQRAGSDDAKAKARARLVEVRQAFMEGKMHAKAVKKELTRIIKEYLPESEQGRFLASVRDATTYGALERGIRHVRRVMADVDRGEALARIKKAIADTDTLSMRPNLAAIAEAILKNLDTKNPTESTLIELRGLRDFLEANPHHLVPSGVRAEIARLGKVPVADLSTEAMHTIADSLEALKGESDLIKDILEQRRLRKLHGVISRASKEMANVFKPRGKGRSGRYLPAPLRILKELATGRETNLGAETLANWAGGGADSETSNVLYHQPAEAQSNALTKQYEWTDAADQLLRDVGIDPGSMDLIAMSQALAGEFGMIQAALGAEAHGSEVKLDADGKPVATPTAEPGKAGETRAVLHTYKIGGQELVLDSMQRIRLICHTQDPSTLDQLIFNEVAVIPSGIHDPAKAVHLKPEDIKMILRSMPDAHVAFANGLVKMFQTLKAETRAFSIRYFGHDITTDQTHVPRTRLKIGEQIAAEPLTVENYLQRTLSDADILKSRSGGKDPIVLDDALIHFYNYAKQVAAITQMTEVLQNARAVLKSPEVGGMIRASGDQKFIDRYLTMYDAMVADALGGGGPSGIAERGVRGILNNFAKGALGFNLSTPLYQLTALLPAATEIEMRHLFSPQAIAAAWAGNVDADIAAFSSFLRARMEGGSQRLAIESSSTQAHTIAGVHPKSEKILFMMRAADNATIRVIWRAAELWAKANGKSKAEAVALAERTVKRTQNTNDPLHASGLALEARTSTVAKMLTMFRSQQFKNVDLLYRHFLEAKRGTEGARWRAVKAVALVGLGQSIGMAMAMEAKRLLVGGGDPKDKSTATSRAVQNTLSTFLGNYYGGSAVASAVNIMLYKQQRQPRFFGIGPLADSLDNLSASSYSVLTNLRWGKRDGIEKAGYAGLKAMNELAALAGFPASPMRDMTKLYNSLVNQKPKYSPIN